MNSALQEYIINNDCDRLTYYIQNFSHLINEQDITEAIPIVVRKDSIELFNAFYFLKVDSSYHYNELFLNLMQYPKYFYLLHELLKIKDYKSYGVTYLMKALLSNDDSMFPFVFQKCSTQEIFNFIYTLANKRSGNNFIEGRWDIIFNHLKTLSVQDLKSLKEFINSDFITPQYNNYVQKVREIIDYSSMYHKLTYTKSFNEPIKKI